MTTADKAVRRAERLGHRMKPYEPWALAPLPEMQATNCAICHAAVIIDGGRVYGDAVERTCKELRDEGAS